MLSRKIIAADCERIVGNTKICSVWENFRVFYDSKNGRVKWGYEVSQVSFRIRFLCEKLACLN